MACSGHGRRLGSSPTESPAISDRRIFLAATPLALAVGVFGVIFGAASSVEFGAEVTVAMSAVVFSGSVQFALVGLLPSGVGVGAIILTVVALNLRHLVLGAAIRPKLHGSRARRALVSWFLVDESFGLAVAAPRRSGRVLVLSGLLLWIGWQVGTFLGVGGAQVVALEGLATAVFPVLFIGLAALTARDRRGAAQAIAAAAIVIGATLAVPDLHPFLPILAALVVALPSGWDR